MERTKTAVKTPHRERLLTVSASIGELLVGMETGGAVADGTISDTEASVLWARVQLLIETAVEGSLGEFAKDSARVAMTIPLLAGGGR